MPTFTENGIEIAYDVVGQGPPVLFLHGFPQTRAMWRRIVAAFSDRFTCITADLRGYGASSKPEPGEEAVNYTFRAMADDQVALMRHLGFETFRLVGHDRGARVAHRLALDHPDMVETLTLMDIVPTLELVTNWHATIAKAYWHWTYLAQPAPFPERMIEADPDHFFEACLLGWGGATLNQFEALDEYRAVWRNPETIAAMTNCYRAGFSLDPAMDAQDAGRRIDCPALVLYGESSVVGRLYDVDASWRVWLSDMRAEVIPGGHFFVDQSPGATIAALERCIARV
jgi:haloacetate dehalogenase